MSDSIGWLHLTDLHLGGSAESTLWHTMRGEFYRDLEVLHQEAGPWDFVFFTGDLVYAGSETNFALVSDEIERLLDRLATFGSTPSFLAVPGNHDLSLPRADSAAVGMLHRWHEDTGIGDVLFANTTNEYRQTIDAAFAHYVTWWEGHQTHLRLPLQPGLLPGEYSVSVAANGIGVGILGLNSSFLQLRLGQSPGKLALDARQFSSAIPDLTKFEEENEFRVLLTHHPQTWLHPDSRETYLSTIYPPDRFALHLSGHIHEPDARTITLGGSAPRRELQGASLFGRREASFPIHGFSAGRFFGGARPVMRIWPRLAVKTHARRIKLVADEQFDLNREGFFDYSLSARLGVPPPDGTVLAHNIGTIITPAAIPISPEDTPRFARRRCRVLPASSPELLTLHSLVVAQAPDRVARELANSIIRDADDSFTSAIASALLCEGLGNIEDMLAAVDHVRFSGIQESYRRLYRAIALDKLDRCKEALADLAFVLLYSPPSSDLIPAAQFNSAVCHEKLGLFERVDAERFLRDQNLTVAGGEKLWHKALTLELVVCARTGKKFGHSDLVEKSLNEEFREFPKGFVKTILNWQMYSAAPLSDSNVQRLLDLEPTMPPTVRAGILGQLRRTVTHASLLQQVEDRCARLAGDVGSYSVMKWLDAERQGSVRGRVSSPRGGADPDYSIHDVLSRLPDDRLKVYLKTYEDEGFELGFGRAGAYPGHAHHHFVDVMFAPTGFNFNLESGDLGSESLLIIPARTWFADIALGDFFFMKFASGPAAVRLPDKTDERLSEGVARIMNAGDTVVLDWFPRPNDRRVVALELSGSRLSVSPQGRLSFGVVP